MAKGQFSVSIAYASKTEQVLLTLAVNENTTVGQAIKASGIVEQCPEIDLAINKVGIFGKKVTLDTVVIAQDRIEIYRPLLIDPKEARRKRV